MARKRKPPSKPRPSQSRSEIDLAKAPPFDHPDDPRPGDVAARIEARIQADPELRQHMHLVEAQAAANAAEEIHDWYHTQLDDAFDEGFEAGKDDHEWDVWDGQEKAYEQGLREGRAAGRQDKASAKEAAKVKAQARSTAWFLLLLAIGSAIVGIFAVPVSLLLGLGVLGFAALCFVGAILMVFA